MNEEVLPNVKTLNGGELHQLLRNQAWEHKKQPLALACPAQQIQS
ncbi:hypothetical protein [Comamonas sp. 4034]